MWNNPSSSKLNVLDEIRKRGPLRSQIEYSVTRELRKYIGEEKKSLTHDVVQSRVMNILSDVLYEHKVPLGSFSVHVSHEPVNSSVERFKAVVSTVRPVQIIELVWEVS